MTPARTIGLIAVILAAAASRLLPHPPNFTPIAALALFGGASFTDRHLAFLIPLAAMLLSDVILGFHALMPVVYGSFGLIVLIGMWLRRRRRAPLAILGAAFTGSITFFVLTNFGVWALGSMYPRTVGGLIAAYVAAIPFFRNTLLGDLFYVAVLFGGFALPEERFPALREVPGSPQGRG